MTPTWYNEGMSTTTQAHHVDLRWHGGKDGGYTAHVGHSMYWTDDPSIFPEAVVPWVSFRVSRSLYVSGKWALRVWTTSIGQPTYASYDYSSMRAAKEAASLIAAAMLNRFDHETRSTPQYLIANFVERAEGAASIWVEFPDQRNEDDVLRLAEVGVEVTL